MGYMMRMVRGKVVVSLLNDAGRVDRSLEFEPDYADHFAELVAECAAKAREYQRAKQEQR